MKIKGELRGTVTIKRIGLYDSTGARMATVHLSARMDRDVTKTLFGDAFAHLVLPEGGGSRDENGAYNHPFTSIKPSGRFESHKVKLFKRTFGVIPEMGAVNAVKDEEAVELELDLPLEVAKDDAGWWGDLAVRVGDTMAADFSPSQLELPGVAEPPKIVKVPGPHGGKAPRVVA